jgi:tetratricopeptide (TPR) repeat protein
MSLFLVLRMRNLVETFLILFVLSACTNGKTSDAILNKEPYGKLSDSIRQAPTNADLYYKRGVLLYQNNELTYAQADLQRAWILAPTEEYALSLTTLLAKKHSDSAITFLQTALQKLPQSVALEIGLARGYQKKGDLQKALAQCNQVLAKHPNSIDALVLKADLLDSMNQDAEALQTLEQAYRLAPFDAELVHNLAFAYAEAKNSKVLALSDSLIASDINAIHAEPYYFKGLYFANTGNKEEAIKQLNAAIQHDYYFLDAYMEKGQLYYNSKQYPEALQTFQLAISVTPTFADAFYWLGKTKEAMGNKAEAKLDYQRAFGLDKNLTEAKQAADKL